MNHSATCLLSILSRSFGGRKIKLAEAAKMRPNVITKLAKGQNFTQQTLASVCSALSSSDAKDLCAACCRDLVPPDFQSILDVERVSPDFDLSALDDESRTNLLKLAHEAATNPETREWLRKLSEWMFPKSGERPG